MDWQAVGLTLKLAFWTTLILLIAALPVAYWITFSPRRWKYLIEAIVALPLVLPPTVLGFYVLFAISPRNAVGQTYEGLTGRSLAFSFEGLLLGSVLYSFPFAVQPFASAFARVDRSLIESAWCLGVSRLQTLFRVIVPLSVPGMVTGMILSFAHTLGEFGVVLMIGGNIPGETRTISIALYDEVQAMNYRAAGETALFLLGASLAILAGVSAFQRKSWWIWPSA